MPAIHSRTNGISRLPIRLPYTTKETTMSLLQYSGLVNLSKKNANFLYENIDTGSYDTFVHRYQSRITKASPEYVSLAVLLEAVERTENEFKQYPVDNLSVKRLAKDVFFEQGWLVRDPLVADLDGSLYIVGGRHRLTAIAATFASIANTVTASDGNKMATSNGEAQDLFDSLIQQNIRVDLLYLERKQDLLTVVLGDNLSRTMRSSEKAHTQVQMMGADPTDESSAAEVVLHSDRTPREMKQLIASVFTLKQHDRLKPQTLQVIGERVAAFILFGVRKGERLNSKAEVKVHSTAEFMQTANLAWNIMSEEVEHEPVVARNANVLSERVIDRLVSSDTSSLSTLYKDTDVNDGSQQHNRDMAEEEDLISAPPTRKATKHKATATRRKASTKKAVAVSVDDDDNEGI